MQNIVVTIAQAKTGPATNDEIWNGYDLTKDKATQLIEYLSSKDGSKLETLISSFNDKLDIEQLSKEIDFLNSGFFEGDFQYHFDMGTVDAEDLNNELWTDRPGVGYVLQALKKNEPNSEPAYERMLLNPHSDLCTDLLGRKQENQDYILTDKEVEMIAQDEYFMFLFLVDGEKYTYRVRTIVYSDYHFLSNEPLMRWANNRYVDK